MGTPDTQALAPDFEALLAATPLTLTSSDHSQVTDLLDWIASRVNDPQVMRALYLILSQEPCCHFAVRQHLLELYIH